MRTLLVGLLLLPVLVGCGASKVKMSGQVRFQGKPLPGGIVTFQPANSKYSPVAAVLDEQGNYEAMLPAGEVEVAVDNRELQPLPPAPSGLPPGLPEKARSELSKAKPPTPPADAGSTTAPSKLRGSYVPIPEKYYTVENSGLKFTADPGNPKHDIELQ